MFGAAAPTSRQETPAANTVGDTQLLAAPPVPKALGVHVKQTACAKKRFAHLTPEERSVLFFLLDERDVAMCKAGCTRLLRGGRLQDSRNFVYEFASAKHGANGRSTRFGLSNLL